MAETKNKKSVKSSNKKKETSKKVSKKTETPKKVKKATSTKTNKVKKVENKKIEDKKVTKINKPKDNTKIIIAILLIAVIILGAGIIYLIINNNNSNSTESTPSTNTNDDSVTDNSVITLTIIEDPACSTCNVDVFADQVKENLINNLKIKKISIESDEGKKAIEELNLNQVPAYLFSENIDQRDDWASKLAGAFIKVQLNGVNEYMLNPQYVPTKVMINEPEILEGTVVYGNPDAKVTIYEFSDYECPFCAIAEGNEELVEQFKARQPDYVPPMPEVFKEYIETGKVKLVFYNMPLTQLHPRVRPAHIAALCANEQGKWIDFHHKLFADRSDWTESDDYSAKMSEYAKELGLDTTKFDECLTSGKYDAQLDKELEYGASLGVSGTPAFFIGKNFISGAQDFSTFKELIDAQLNVTN